MTDPFRDTGLSRKTGRPPIGKRAMSPAERQRRSRRERKRKAKDRGLSLYPSHPSSLERLLEVESLPHRIWEPCAGTGSLVGVLRRGYEVVANDIDATLGWPVQDFYEASALPNGVEAICTNPPYSYYRGKRIDDHGTKWVRHALSLRPAVPMWFLLSSDFLHGVTRADLHAKLVRVWLFRGRLPRMHRVGYEGRKAGAVAWHGWFLFHHEHDGRAPTVGWL